jgi:serine/threonine-protein kinase
LPDDQRIPNSNRGVVAISPDGSRVAYAANQRLYLRALDQAAATPLPGTEAPLVQDAPRSPFFSPDGQWVAFYQAGQLKKVSVNGGGPIAMGSVPDYIGGSWGSDDQILLGGGATGGGIFQIAAGGGAAKRLFTGGEGDRLTKPYALPGGDWILYTNSPIGASMGKLLMRSRATGETRELLDGIEDGRYVQSGHLVFMRANTLFAQAFDATTRTIRGQPVQILEGVANAAGISMAQAAVSSSGTLVFIGTNRERSLTSSLVHVTRDGKRAVLATVSGLAWFPRYSPDGARVAFGLSAVTDLNEPSDLWVVDVVRGARTRITFAENTRFYPTWSRDGTRLAFANGTGLTNRLQSAVADGSGGLESLTDVDTRRFPTSWSPDGRTLAVHAGGGRPPNFQDLLMLHSDGGKWTAHPFVGTPFDERGAIFSPNGQWVAYVSNKSGIDDIYARPFPGPGAEVTISVGGGVEPVWGPSGRELFYRRDGKLMVVRIEERGGSLVVNAPTPVFDDSYRPDTSGAQGGVANYDIAPDGKRFVMVEEPQEIAATQITRIEVILNWLDELKRRVPSR